MCKVGGPRCSGSHKPTATQRARRKANAAYRNAVADAVFTNTGDEALARRVRHANMTDLHDIVTAGGFNAEVIAKKCGTTTYTSPDGETATVDVEPAGTVRRTPVSDETKALIADIDDAMGTLPAGFYRNAVLAGDRDKANELRDEADQIVTDVLDRAATIDLNTATDDEIETTLTRLNNLDNMSLAMRGRGFKFSEDDGSYQVWDRIKDEHERRLNKTAAQETHDDEDPTVYDDGYLDVDGIASGTITVTPDNADDVADAITDEFAATDLAGMSDDEFEEFYDHMNTLDDKLRDAGHDGVYELSHLAEEYDYRNQDEDDKYAYGDEYRRSTQLTNWTYDTARDFQPEGMEFGMWRAAQYLEDDEYFTGSENDGIDWAERVLRHSDAYSAFEVGVAQNALDKREWKRLKHGSEDVSALSDAQVEDYESRINDLVHRMDEENSPLLSTDYNESRRIRERHQALLEEKHAREERAYEREQEHAATDATAAGAGSSQIDSPESRPEDQDDAPEGKTWSVGEVVWAPTKGDVFARVVTLTDKSVTLEELAVDWDNAGSKGKQTYSPGAPTGRTYRRQIQRNAAGDMTCKAGPTRSSAMMVAKY